MLCQRTRRAVSFARADGLGDDRIGARDEAHSDEAEREEDAVADADRAERGLAEAPDHGGVDEAEERRAGVAEGERQSEDEQLLQLASEGSTASGRAADRQPQAERRPPGPPALERASGRFAA